MKGVMLAPDIPLPTPTLCTPDRSATGYPFPPQQGKPSFSIQSTLAQVLMKLPYLGYDGGD